MNIEPSILNINLKHRNLKVLERFCTRIHIDVMDGKFVGHKTKYTPQEVSKIKTKLEKDVHLMVEKPEPLISKYKKAGAKIINFHLEIGRTEKIITLIKKHKMKVGLVINPETPVKDLKPYIHVIDEVLIMTVHPGKGGQKLIKSCVKKIKQVRKLKKDITIKVDGGIDHSNYHLLKKADILCVGHYLFSHNTIQAIASLDLKKVSTTLRKDVLKMLIEAKSGHPGGSLGMADVFATLYSLIKIDPHNPNWDERDYVVLSNGHICPILYATLAYYGFFDRDELMSLRKFGSRLQGHPHRESLPGLETTSGPLGCGISQASGMALALKMDKKDNKVYCLVSDGEHDEGNTWEGVMFASKYKLNNLICLMDYNGIQLSGDVKDIMPLGNIKKKYKAFGWNVKVINGHNHSKIEKALKIKSKKPLMIICKTIPGKGVHFMENKWEWHGKAPDNKALEVFEE